MLRHGQAMLETVLAVLVITFVFLALFKLSHLLTGKILLEHAAMRVARMRAVGFNDFMCLKMARVAVMPVSGKRIWPQEQELDSAQEAARVRAYFESPDAAHARGLFEFEGWQHLSVDSNDGKHTTVTLQTDWFKLTGKAGIEGGCDYYMELDGL